jgi:hypothetical protein
MGDHLLIVKDYIEENMSIIPEIKDLLLEIVLSFKDFDDEELIPVESDTPIKIPRHINLSLLWKDVVLLIVEKCPETLGLIRKTILDNLSILPTLVSQPDVQSLMINFLEIDKKGTLDDLERKFTDGSEIYKFFQFYFDNEFLNKIPEEWIISLCKKDLETFPQYIVRMIDERIQGLDSPPNLIVRLIEEFHENERLKMDLIHSFEKGVKIYLPGRSQGIVLSYIRVLKDWKKQSTSKVFDDWIDQAIDYFERQSGYAQIRDEETVKPVRKRDKDFYEREKWLESIKNDYLGEMIAFSNIEGKWKVLAHSTDDDELFMKLKELEEEGKLNKDLIVKFRRF